MARLGCEAEAATVPGLRPGRCGASVVDDDVGTRGWAKPLGLWPPEGREHPDALLVKADAVTVAHRHRTVEFAETNKVAARAEQSCQLTMSSPSGMVA